MDASDNNKKVKSKTKKVKEKAEEKTSELKDKIKEETSKLTPDSDSSTEETNNLKKEIKNLKDKNLRLLAEADNQKKEYFKTMMELEHNVGQRLIKKILPLFDSYERAVQINQTHQDSKVKQFLAGFKMALARFQKDFFQAEKIEEIKVASQKSLSDYNSDEIEIIASEENNDYPEGTILQVSQKGYHYQGKVLRPAEVIISKKKS
ncbi:nucleotide exchange factor GrpE [endosymbiont GvMRE of Glomus versiforme]|uniref:nucleotide exchange factor GrpE n=1 Tax=endosymbiont GvMRE of Glomus versiforme TaxID=2039283 RepID=UPI000ED8924A|nr:nucleotide exchange factor GrpE [endosymbiont GvMRE of Glomus versiforme]RHZ36750.1 Protein GrpE [endosymbiont GvMRE of Glomus versiforme]